MLKRLQLVMHYGIHLIKKIKRLITTNDNNKPNHGNAKSLYILNDKMLISIEFVVAAGFALTNNKQ